MPVAQTTIEMAQKGRYGSKKTKKQKQKQKTKQTAELREGTDKKGIESGDSKTPRCR